MTSQPTHVTTAPRHMPPHKTTTGIATLPPTTLVVTTDSNQLVAYCQDKKILAISYPMPERRMLHGSVVLDNYICVKLCYAKENVRSPLLLGDEEENAFLQKDMFFAFPIRDLFSLPILLLFAASMGSATTLNLSPFN